ncbi:hypothetical protein D3C86_1024600 [compost metagenome]
MDGCDALPDAEAGRGGCGDELECARLQHETGHENHRCSRFDEGAVSLRKLILADPRGCKNSIEVFQIATDATRNINRAIVHPRTSMIQDKEAMSVFTHSGPIVACQEGLHSTTLTGHWNASERLLLSTTCRPCNPPHSRVEKLLIVSLGDQLIRNGQLCCKGFFPDHPQCQVNGPDSLAFVVLVDGYHELILLDRV